MLSVCNPLLIDDPPQTTGDWTLGEAPLAIPNVCRVFRRGRMPADLSPWCNRWVSIEGIDDSLCLTGDALRINRGYTALWYQIQEYSADGAVRRGRLLAFGAKDHGLWVPVRSIIGHLLILLNPGAARTVLGIPGQELTFKNVSIADLWGRPGAELDERLALAAGHAARLRLIADTLRIRISQARIAQGAELILGLDLLRQNSRIQDLSHWTGYSQRHLERLFNDHVGLSPKRLTSLLRAGDALRHALQQRRPTWTTLAADHGFVDQAHLTRSWSHTFSLPPARLHALCRAGGIWCDGMVFFPHGRP
jgi:AraC-like DNA-binding protein